MCLCGGGDGGVAGVWVECEFFRLFIFAFRNAFFSFTPASHSESNILSAEIEFDADTKSTMLTELRRLCDRLLPKHACKQ